MYVAIHRPRVHHAACMCNAQSITSALSHLNRGLQRIHPQQQLRRDCDRQQRGIETPENRRRLERLKQNRESGTQEDALISLIDVQQPTA